MRYCGAKSHALCTSTEGVDEVTIASHHELQNIGSEVRNKMYFSEGS